MTHHFLRSVSIRDDLAVPSRFDHYHPTSRSLKVARAVLFDSTTMVIAAYGSGKSLSAGIGALAVENAPENCALLRSIADRIASVDPDLGKEIKERIDLGSKGKVIALSGYVRDFPKALAAALGPHPVEDLEQVLSTMSRMMDYDRVAIIWDEFGRHLEGLVTEGRTRELDAIQRLAEWTSRSGRKKDGPTVSLTLLLHQNLLAYAGSVNQGTRNEWRKIEGRFTPVRFIEDSRELYGFVASIINGRRSGLRVDRKKLIPIAQKAVDARWFDGMADADQVADLLAKVHPLSAGALQVLPRLAARVAQNERSLFSFIEEVDLDSRVGMLEVYAAFSEAMRSDVGIGGMHRRWVEAESALSKAEDEVERESIAAAFLLQLGASGERRHLPIAVLELAVTSKGYATDRVAKALDALIKRKLLLYRKLNDDVSIWHGADVDIASRLLEERERRAANFNLLAFLNQHHPAPFVRPTRHNAETGTSRYLTGIYATRETLKDIPEYPEVGIWGRIVYVLCNSKEDARAAKAFAKQNKLKRTVIVVPNGGIQVLEASIEVEALAVLRRDETLLAEDPLVAQELDELLAVARRHLTVILHRLTTDRPTSATWYADGVDLKLSAHLPAGVKVSDRMSTWFSKTPYIINDQVMRANLSRQMQTARVRMITRLMEHSTKPMLAYEGDTSAESSIYRTVLQHTGLHYEESGEGRFTEPERLKDEGLREAWGEVKEFFTEPGDKELISIIKALSGPPIGLPAGVIPIIVMAGYRAFGRTVSIWTDDVYVQDVLGFDSTRMFLEPSRHKIQVHQFDKDIETYLREVAHTFSGEHPGPHDELVRMAWDAIRSWRAGVADSAVRSKRLPPEARMLLRELNEVKSPPDFLLQSLPDSLGQALEGNERYETTVKRLFEARNQIDRLVDGYLRDAVEVIMDVLRLDGAPSSIESVCEWVSCLDVDASQLRNMLRQVEWTVVRDAKAMVERRLTTEMLARTISSMLLQRGIEKWQDDTKELLRKELRAFRDRVEAAALDAKEPSEAVAPIIKARIRQLQAQLDRIMGAQGGNGQ
ncbi:hypothetical protein DC522_19030 [Microvirga sp. KLBC 81]|uniref:hypothetical protein n=1 Tax=Microvirga sp. KLBC 81 TaxID=1862707 RepID=UPI000D50B10A|nr:hypothetical protein [Microvirga sp. KLBC 81]PVE22860.1 hypothetical protein DC522_19030 [Microvirga sp. KLBC 81]